MHVSTYKPGSNVGSSYTHCQLKSRTRPEQNADQTEKTDKLI